MRKTPPLRPNHTDPRSMPEPDAFVPNRSGPPDNEGSETTAEFISSNKARGALSSEEGTSGDTLLPMLIGGLGLTTFGLTVVFLIV